MTEIRKLTPLTPRPEVAVNVPPVDLTRKFVPTEPVKSVTEPIEAKEVLPLTKPRVETAKAKMSYYLDKQLVAEYKNAFHATAHITGVDTTSDFIAQALRLHIERLAQEFNGGEAFPNLDRSVPRGPRAK